MMRLLSLFLVVSIFNGCNSLKPVEETTWYEIRWGGIVRQENDTTCALGSLLTILQFHQGDMRYKEADLVNLFVQNRSPADIARAMKEGLSLVELTEIAKHIGYDVETKMMSYEQLEKIVSVVPVLVYLEIGTKRHFAVVVGIAGNKVHLADPARGHVYYSRERFLTEWRSPKEFLKIWPQPGGLMIFGKKDAQALRLLRNPPDRLAGQKLLQRQMIIGR